MHMSPTFPIPTGEKQEASLSPTAASCQKWEMIGQLVRGCVFKAIRGVMARSPNRLTRSVQNAPT